VEGEEAGRLRQSWGQQIAVKGAVRKVRRQIGRLRAVGCRPL
jgi:hypothetical protein